MGFFDWFSASKNNAENSGSSVKNSQDIQDKDEIQVQASNDLAIQNEYETEISESDEEVTSEAATKVEIQDSWEEKLSKIKTICSYNHSSYNLNGIICD